MNWDLFRASELAGLWLAQRLIDRGGAVDRLTEYWLDQLPEISPAQVGKKEVL